MNNTFICESCQSDLDITLSGNLICQLCSSLKKELRKSNILQLSFQVCDFCDKKYLRNRRTKYCSVECQRQRQLLKEKLLNQLAAVERQLQLKNIVCKLCDSVFDASCIQQRFCSSKCAQRFRIGFKSAVGESIRCQRCGKSIVNTNGRRKYCSKTCQRAGTHSDYRSRAKRWGVEFDASVTIASVIARSGRRCCECGELVLGEHSSKANQEGPSIDHVIPMSAGGAHVWGNVELVHLRCNLKRWGRHRTELKNAS